MLALSSVALISVVIVSLPFWNNDSPILDLEFFFLPKKSWFLFVGNGIQRPQFDPRGSYCYQPLTDSVRISIGQARYGGAHL